MANKRSWLKEIDYGQLTDEHNVLHKDEVSLEHKLMLKVKDRVINAIAKLCFSKREAEVYEMNTRNNMNYTQIAESLGIKEATCRTYIHRINKKIDVICEELFK